MPALFTLSGAVEHDPAIDQWLEARPSELAPIANDWFKAMRGCGTNVRELMHDGCPNVCVQDAPFAYVNAFRSHVNVGFFHGASLPDPEGLFGGRRQIHASRKAEAWANHRFFCARGSYHCVLPGYPHAIGGCRVRPTVAVRPGPSVEDVTSAAPLRASLMSKVRRRGRPRIHQASLRGIEFVVFDCIGKLHVSRELSS